jgi:sugar O-acyltransferase (sialic acid O-acetyltransferase NeuD family)
MTELILVGASGLAREVIAAAAAQDRYEVIGMVDDDLDRAGSIVGGVSVLGGLDAVARYPGAAVLICAGKGSVRAKLAARLGLDDARYGTVIHPSVHVPASCEVGLGVIMLAGCVLTADVTIGNHVVFMPHVTATHDDHIDDFATLCAGVVLGGSVHIGAASYLGMNAAVRENVAIGAQATVGMGAVVLSDMPIGATWIGVPARTLDATRPSEAGRT